MEDDPEKINPSSKKSQPERDWLDIDSNAPTRKSNVQRVDFARLHRSREDAERNMIDPTQALADEARAASMNAKSAINAYGEALKFLKDNKIAINDEIFLAEKRGDERLWIRRGSRTEPTKALEVVPVSILVKIFTGPIYEGEKEAVHAAVVEWLRQRGRLPTLQAGSDGVYLDFTKKGDVPHR